MEQVGKMQFVIQPDGLRSIKNSYLKWSIGLGCILIVTMGFTGGISFKLNAISRFQSYADLAAMLYLAVIVTIVIFVQQRKINDMYNNYTVVIGDDSVEKFSHNHLKMVRISSSDICEIRRTYNGDLYIYRKSVPDTLFIPHQIEKGEELENLLKNISPRFTSGPYNFYQRNFGIVACLFLVALAIDFFADNKTIIIADSILLTILLLIAMIKRRKNNEVRNQSANKIFYLIYSVLVVVIIGNLLFKLLK